MYDPKRFDEARLALIHDAHGTWQRDVLRLRESGLTPDARAAACQRLKDVNPMMGFKVGAQTRDRFYTHAKASLRKMNGVIPALARAGLDIVRIAVEVKIAVLGGSESTRDIKALNGLLDEVRTAPTPEQRDVHIKRLLRRGEDIKDRTFGKLLDSETADAKKAAPTKSAADFALSLDAAMAYAFTMAAQDSGVDLTEYGGYSTAELEAFITDPHHTPETDTPSPVA